MWCKSVSLTRLSEAMLFSTSWQANTWIYKWQSTQNQYFFPDFYLVSMQSWNEIKAPLIGEPGISVGVIAESGANQFSTDSEFLPVNFHVVILRSCVVAEHIQHISSQDIQGCGNRCSAANYSDCSTCFKVGKVTLPSWANELCTKADARGQSSLFYDGLQASEGQLCCVRKGGRLIFFLSWLCKCLCVFHQGKATVSRAGMAGRGSLCKGNFFRRAHHSKNGLVSY